jgi:16S rRNA (guanine1207-N2)-methyltransferase
VPAATLTHFTLLAPHGTLERRYTMAHMLRALKPNAPFTVLAPRDKGGSRLAKELAQFECAVTEHAKHHYRICSGQRPEHLRNMDEAIADGAPRFSPELGMWTQPGVFSWNRVDVGSTMLMRHLPELSGSGADLGCGIGYLSRAALASPAVTHITLLDSDRRAVAMARQNVDAARSTIIWGDIKKPPTLNLDFVVMNPPFHDGGAEDKFLGQQFIHSAAGMLRAGGSVWLVANRHLPYETMMKPLFTRITLRVEENGFKIYEAIK